MAEYRPDATGMFELVDGYLQGNPRHAGLLIRRGQALQHRGELPAAYRDYSLAAEQGDVWAQTMTGRFVFNGWGGVPVDHERGLELFRAAAATGDKEAQRCLTDALERLGRRDEAAQAKQRLASQKRLRPHSWDAGADEERAAPQGWFGHVVDRRVQAVALGAFMILLIVAREKRRS
jgi:TPR repeat protein